MGVTVERGMTMGRRGGGCNCGEERDCGEEREWV